MTFRSSIKGGSFLTTKTRNSNHKDTKAQKRRQVPAGTAQRSFVPFRLEFFVSWCLGGSFLLGAFVVLAQHQIAAVMIDDLPREPLAGIRGQEHNHGGQIFNSSHPAQRKGRAHFLLLFLGVEPASPE